MAKKRKPTQNIEQKRSPIQTVLATDEAIAKLTILKDLEIQKALTSTNVDEIWKAQNYMREIEKRKEGSEPRSMMFDPQQAWGAQGYKQKSYNLSFEMLRAMGRTSIIKPIINTRIEQVISFCEPQKDKYSTGFVIVPRKHKMKNGKIELTKEQEKRIEFLTEFMMNCGLNQNEWHGDNFHEFTRKFLRDSLSLDQGTFEIIPDRRGSPTEFIATDGATFRVADSKDGEERGKKKEQVQGYWPAFVQVYQGAIVQEFYPWELCFGIRNPQTSIHSNGYGRSELEDLIENVTNMLNIEQYNGNYFKVGSTPKGIIRVSGNVNAGRMEEFKTSWQATMAGVRNCIHADTIIWTKELGGQEIENVLRGEDKKRITIWTGTNWETAEVYKTEPKEVCKTRLNCGLDIQTSPEHRFATINNDGDFEWTEQKNLQVGDHVLVNKNSYLDGISFTYNGKPITREVIEILGWMIGDGSIFFNEWDRISRSSKGRILLYFHHDKELDILNRYKKILSDFGINVSEIVREITEEQAEKQKRYYKFKTVSRKHHALQIMDKDFVRFLIEKLGFQRSCDGKVVPEQIFNLPESFRCAFLRGLFSADGNKEGKYGARLAIQNNQLRKQVRILLVSVGVRTTNCELTKPREFFDRVICTPKFLTIRDNDVFHEKIGFIQEHKQPIEKIVESLKVIPDCVTNKYLLLAKEVHKKSKLPLFNKNELAGISDSLTSRRSWSLNRLLKILDKANIKYPKFWNDYYFEKVVAIDRTGVKECMYDVEVFNNTHAFVADGIIVHNSHKMAVMEADKMDFVSTQGSNKDMEYGKYEEFLIKVGCAHYNIDPSEINFHLSGSSESKPMFEGGNEARLKFSKDKGLKPLVKWYFNRLNKFILHRLDDEYEMQPAGMDAEDPSMELEHDLKAVQYFMTVNEVRRKRGMEDIEGGDIILSPILMQQKMMESQTQMGGSNPGADYTDQEQYSEEGKKPEDNPITKALSAEIEKIFC